MKKNTELDEGDWLWVLVRVARLQADGAGKLEHVTVDMPNGHKETLAYNPDEMKKADR